jgi:hypothetical protein
MPDDILVPQEDKTAVVLSGAEKYLDGKYHTGIAVDVTSGTGHSTLMIPDASAKEPVYITKPIGIVGAALKKFLTTKGVTLPDAVGNLIEDTTISCDAFYYSKDVTLMAFALKFDKGAISSLVGTDIGDLFDITGASVRILKCDESNFKGLQKYAAGLSE